MEVSDIHEYIDKIRNHILSGKLFNKAMMKVTLSKISCMLDELEDRPKGKWEYDKNNFIGVKCSECGCYFFFDDLPISYHLNLKYCSNCGAKMEG